MAGKRLSVTLASGEFVSCIDELVGKRVRRRRRLLGLSQAELGKRVGLSFQQIQKFECGATQTTCSRIFDLANALGVAPDYFFEGLGEACQTRAGEAPADLAVDGPAGALLKKFRALGRVERRVLLDVAKLLCEDPRASATHGEQVAS